MKKQKKKHLKVHPLNFEKVFDSTKETAQQTERSAAKHTEYEQIFQQTEEMNYKDSFTVQLERIRKEKKEKFERHRNKNSEAITENDRSICSSTTGRYSPKLMPIMTLMEKFLRQLIFYMKIRRQKHPGCGK